MTQCLPQAELEERAQSVLAGFEFRIANTPAEQCAAFHEEAKTLEVELLALYRTIVICVRNEEDLEKIAQWWTFMVKTCDQWAMRLSGLSKAHPASGAEIYYDRVLDLRNKCRRLQEMHT